MTLLYLIRHGENDYLKKGILIGTTPGVHLNDIGKEQAMHLADALIDQRITAIYSSPLERAIETAKPLADVLKLRIIIHQDLTDTNVGIWAGQKIKELRKLPEWKTIKQKPSLAKFPGGDAFPELQKRLVHAINEILADHSRKDRIAVFFHADPIKLILASFLGMPLDNFQRLVIDTASISLLNIEPSGVTLISLNQRCPPGIK